MYCKNCGAQLDDNADLCVKCGVFTDKGRALQAGSSTQVADNPDTGLNILCFLIPLIGFVYYAVNHEKLPYKSESAGKWALAGFIIGLLGWLFLSLQ